MSQSSPTELTPKHVRAARALLAWSQQDLAKAANIATSTLADFERGHRTPVANNAQAIRDALEGAGIQFLPTGAVIGPTVPTIAASDRPAMPVRWVNADQLSNWANLAESVLNLPTLISHLINATHGSGVQLNFPSDTGVWHSGWDGWSVSEASSAYVPAGVTGWEIGSQRDNIARKATDDYRKRTEAPGHIEPAESTYIFVTPRHWPKKLEWSEARRKEARWQDVRAYDVVDLVHWIEQAPAVGLWLAARLGGRPSGIRELDEIWREWSLATKWPLTEELVLCDRDEDAVEVLRWLRGDPSILSLQGSTSEEAIAFVHAALSELPEELGAHYRARCLVATTAGAARSLANAPGPLILLLSEPEPGLGRSLAQSGHYVLLAYGDQPIGRGEVRTLARPSREGIANALAAAGIAEPRAGALARDSARNLAVLRRLIPAAPGGLPKWALGPPPHALLAAMLAGGWDEDAEADRARLSEIADQPYEAIIAALTAYVGQVDSPLQKVGSTWRVASPADAWVLLASHLTSADIQRFEAAAHAVLGSADPRFDLDPDERWMASLRGVHREYSGMIRHGIGRVLILLALWGDRVATVPEAGARAEAIVAKLLREADGRRWWSLSNDFRLLSEAAPAAFLAAIEDSLDQNDPPIRTLFGHDEGVLFGTEHLSDLMWALESLAWSPDWLPRVSHALARLDAIDVTPRRYSNGPANSLAEIHKLWLPQTYAPLEQRLRALDLIRKHEPGSAWKLMLGILPTGHGISHPSPMPFWRDFSVDNVESVTYGLVGRGAAAISERLLSDVGFDAERWIALLDRLADLAPEPAAGVTALEAAEPGISEPGRGALWSKLRELLHHHREFADTDWALPGSLLDRLESVYERFSPNGTIAQSAWLFSYSARLPTPSREGWQAEEREVEHERRRAAREAFATGGAVAVLALAKLAETPGLVGKALYESGLGEAELGRLIEASVRSSEAQERDLAHGLIVSAFADHREPWAGALIAKAKSEDWGENALLTILRALPVMRWSWDQAAQIGGELEQTYWRRAPIYWIEETDEGVIHAVRMLISVGRARHALALAERRKSFPLPSGLLVELLEESLRQPVEGELDGNEAAMFRHNVSEIFEELDRRDDVENTALVRLEWNYLRVLEHSRRPAKALLKALSEQPSLFVEMLSAVFKPSEESGVVDPEPIDAEHARNVATHAYRLLEIWDRVPGTRDDGTIDARDLEKWIKEARKLAKAAGREDMADSRIGTILSASPTGTDGNWPAEPVREVFELFRSKAMQEGFVVGKRNRRGVTTRLPREGGKLERQEAMQYRIWAEAVVYDHPRMARALDELAEAYDREAVWHDEDAERMDWGN